MTTIVLSPNTAMIKIADWLSVALKNDHSDLICTKFNRQFSFFYNNTTIGLLFIKTAIGIFKSEVRSQKSEVRSQKSEVRSQKSEVRSQK
ncbi:MAG: hypothetical protein JXR69_11460, partial [Candidatus Delongbacteria bacterium]|nr:hypothetical protein [Candidatus Delongbacteria bacterium]